MNRHEIDELDDAKLIWTCVEPIVLKTRAKNPEIKSQVFMQLNNGQRALFLFQVLYGHTNYGVSQFYQQISYFIDTLDVWSGLKSAMKYFDDIEMLGLIEKMEEAYYRIVKQNETVSLDELDRLYRDRLPLTLKLIGSFIRNNPEEFIQIED